MSLTEVFRMWMRRKGEMGPELVTEDLLTKILEVTGALGLAEFRREVVTLVRFAYRHQPEQTIPSVAVRRADRDGETPLAAGAEMPAVATLDELCRFNKVVIYEAFQGPTNLAQEQANVGRVSPGHGEQTIAQFTAGPRLIFKVVLQSTIKDHINWPTRFQVIYLHGAIAMSQDCGGVLGDRQIRRVVTAACVPVLVSVTTGMKGAGRVLLVELGATKLMHVPVHALQYRYSDKTGTWVVVGQGKRRGQTPDSINIHVHNVAKRSTRRF